jgi:23S rRNA pseudouridine1911/1915/1917 synthase
MRNTVDLPPLHILYEDNHCLAITKPPGTLTTGYEGGEETLDRQVKAYLREKYHKPGNVFLGVVHRLDRPASGVLLYARTSKAAGRLAEQFREGQTVKLYWAIVAGRVEPETALLEDWLWKDHQTGIVEVRPPNDPQAKQAKLEYRRMATDGRLSWVEVRLLTGRTHQIRVQFASRGHPIYGDTKYGSKEDFSPLIALHARSLTFLHPIKYEPITLTADLPPAWARFQHLGLPL